MEGNGDLAEFYDATHEFGSIAPGQRADLVLLESDPTADLANFADRAGVMVNGRWISEAEIQAELEAIAARVAAAVQ